MTSCYGMLLGEIPRTNQMEPLAFSLLPTRESYRNELRETKREIRVLDILYIYARQKHRIEEESGDAESMHPANGCARC